MLKRAIGHRRHQAGGLYSQVALLAMEEALHERPIDRCWDTLKEVFDRPDVQAAEAVIMRAIAEAFVPNGNGRHRKVR